MNSQKETQPLADRVKEWLQKQGYPLEFQTAATFGEMGMDAVQGYYVQDKPSGPTRELDVVATLPRDQEKTLVDINIVAECKWSRDKPWVVFTAPRVRMAPSACIAQTIGSALGRAVMYCLAGNEDLHIFETFASRERNGFGGRMAFSAGNDQDLFYSTVQAVVAKAIAYAKTFDNDEKPDQMPSSVCLTFPMIVLEGELFEAYYDSEMNDLHLSPVESIRLHWRGAEYPGQWISTLDIVRFDSLRSLISRRKSEWEKLHSEVQAVLPALDRCFRKRSLASLKIRAVARGYVGLPKLLYELRRLGKVRVAKP